MKKNIVIIALALVDWLQFALSRKEALTFGTTCESSSECQSHMCVPICNSATKSCTEPDWYYLRHGQQIPTCIEPSYVRRSVGGLIGSKRQRLGNTCHSDINCHTKHCVPSCESSSTVWKCVEPRSFFEAQKLDLPLCAEQKFVTSHSNKREEKEKVKTKVPLVTPKLEGSKNIEKKTTATLSDPSKGLALQYYNVLRSKEREEKDKVKKQVPLILPKLKEPKSIEDKTTVTQSNPSIGLTAQSYVTSHSNKREEKKEVKEQAPLVNPKLKGSKIIEKITTTTIADTTKGLGESCSQHSNCFSNNCVAICESPQLEKESRCIESITSFNMYNRPIPKCVSREAVDLVKLVVSSTTGKDRTGTNNMEKIIWSSLDLLSKNMPVDTTSLVANFFKHA